MDVYHTTVRKRHDGYVEMLLCDKLGGDPEKLPTHVELDEQGVFMAFKIGEKIVQLSQVFYDHAINYCGIPFDGDIIAASVEGMSAHEMSQIELHKTVAEELTKQFAR